ncbi:MAG TPA: hypothetical protein P5121_24705 [Caldilineaceae bacterium]|nr:hypothetical protein [Caldilineaceae bacterium]
MHIRANRKEVSYLILALLFHSWQGLAVKRSGGAYSIMEIVRYSGAVIRHCHEVKTLARSTLCVECQFETLRVSGRRAS